jgi:hypothetical protein
MTGVASAQMLRPPTIPSLLSSTKAEAVPPAKTEAAPPARQEGSQPSPRVVARQAPVPMQLKPRVPIAVKEAAPQEANRTETALPETIRGISDANAKAAIEADGYKRVRVLSKSEDGTWRARAFRGAVEVALRVDEQGNVMAE